MELKSRRQAIAAYSASKTAARASNHVQPGMVAASPCDGCHHAQRCAAGLACGAMALFLSTGRISTSLQPRQPSAAIFRELFR